MSAISPQALSGSSTSSSEEPYAWGFSELGIDALDAITFTPARSKPWHFLPGLKHGIARRWRRERRRRKLGRAYDMALEIARVIPRGSRTLDVGCGNGYVTHHLSALLGTEVRGIDIAATTEAPISYQQFDGKSFPVADASFDVVLFCYVLHHAQDLKTIWQEVRRSLRRDGLVIIYEDIPERRWDRIACAIHNRKWRRRTGPCTFRGEREWRDTFASEGFDLCTTRRLSRWRNVAHPVSRRFFLLRFRDSIEWKFDL